MSKFDDWSERRRRLAMRPDAHRFLPRNPPRWATKEEIRLFWGDNQSERDSIDRAERSAIVAEFDELLRLKRELEEIKSLLRLRRELRELKIYHPNQPRVPAGSREGGQWAREGGQGTPIRVAGPVGPRGPGRYGANFPGATHGQLVRLDAAIARSQDAIARVRQYDPNWQPRTQSLATPGSIEGEIRHNEARAEEALARLDQLRLGIGGNRPPLETGPRTSEPPVPGVFDGQPWIDTYRTANNMPDLFGRPMWPNDKGTVAVTDFNGKLIFGVNAEAPGYSDAEWEAARRTRDIFIEKYPNILDVGNSGWRPNDSFFHAESTILFRAANENGGTLAGKTLEVVTDRDLCGSCKIVLPLIGSSLGNPTVTFTNHRTGDSWLLENGSIRKVK